MRMPKPILTLESEDGVSGTTIFDDGAKQFWGEGHGVAGPTVLANGTVEVEEESGIHVRATESGIGGIHRPMNLLEEHEHRMMMSFSEVGRHR